MLSNIKILTRHGRTLSHYLAVLLYLLPFSAIAQDFTIVSPQNESTFAPNTQVTIQIDPEFAGQFELFGLLYPGKLNLTAFDESEPFELKTQLPGHRLEPLTVRIFGKLSDEDVVVSKELTFLFEQNANLVALEANFERIFLKYQGEEHQIRVRGKHDNGSNPNIESASLGTTYSTQSGGSSVVSVSPDGLITALGEGEETIIISNLDLTTEMSVGVIFRNARPELSSIGDIEVTTDEGPHTIPLSATDANGDPLVYTVENLPDFGELIDNGDNTATLQLDPQTGDEGTYSVRIVVNDNNEEFPLSDSEAIDINVVTPVDSDDDGISDTFDNCPNAGNPSQTDTDNDGSGDACDTDDDSDGVSDDTDNCPLLDNPSQADNDSDGSGDECDQDDDNDGTDDENDNCPFTSNSSQIDTDSDGQGDACDLDDDNDGVSDVSDNCPLFSNPSQVDSDNDGVGNGCDESPGTITSSDFDSDGKADLSVWRPSNGKWYFKRSSDGRIKSYQWGLSGDIPVLGDYLNKGTPQLAVWRPSNGYWFIKEISTGNTQQHQWGLTGDIPMPGDFNGDGATDLAVYRPSNGRWYVKFIGASGCPLGFTPHYTGCEKRWGSSGDIPVRGDFDGDAKADPAFWRPSNGTWYIRKSSNNRTMRRQWGRIGHHPIPADFDGDGKTDFVMYEDDLGLETRFYVFPSSGVCPPGFEGDYYGGCQNAWGLPGDSSVPADYNGDGLADVAVWRPNEGNWYLKEFGTHQFGRLNDIPLP